MNLLIVYLSMSSNSSAFLWRIIVFLFQYLASLKSDAERDGVNRLVFYSRAELLKKSSSANKTIYPVQIWNDISWILMTSTQ
jgi:hypothetical protein